MIVVITGASKGIGKAVAKKFATYGHTLALCARNIQPLQAASGELKAAHPQCTIYTRAVDISIKEDVIDFGKWILSEVGTPGVIINNAAYFINSSIHDEEDGLLEKMLTTNLNGAYHLTRTLLPPMVNSRQGHIFNICSIASFRGNANGGSYSISKFALAGLTKNLREELKPHNIKVTGVYPGSVYTDSWEGSGVQPQSIIQASDIAELIYTASQLSAQACVEDIIIRPLEGERFNS
ncbi:MAG TPA: SDR family oxidoreductase [Chitinophagaceae bacterium]|nr:SDR family oxidoreductase [Chitinophagaceae bacterium]